MMTFNEQRDECKKRGMIASERDKVFTGACLRFPYWASLGIIPGPMACVMHASCDCRRIECRQWREEKAERRKR